MKTFYILYQVTNNLNGKIYVGVHKTKDLDDGYMGSGKVIKRAIEKHGIENFTKVILEQFDTSAAMYAREKEVVTDEFLLREDTYNLRRGGTGGFDFINKDPDLQNNRTLDGCRRGGRKATELLKGIHSKESRAKLVELLHNNQTGFYDSNVRTLGMNAARSADSIQKRKNTYACIGHQQGIKNSSFGKMWITDGIESRKIPKYDLVPNGWRRGRVFL